MVMFGHDSFTHSFEAMGVIAQDIRHVEETGITTEWIKTKTLSCDPGSLWIFESQCESEHYIRIGKRVGADGFTRAVVGFMAKDTSGAFTSSSSAGGMGHSVHTSIRFAPGGQESIWGGTITTGFSKNLVIKDPLAFMPEDDGYAYALYDMINPGIYTITVKSNAGGVDCCTPGGTVSTTIRLEPDEVVETTDTSTESSATQGGPSAPSSISGGSESGGVNPIVIGIISLGGFILVGMLLFGSKSSDSGDAEV
jgi:hypothetical protein